MNTRPPISMSPSAGERLPTASARAGQAPHRPSSAREGSRGQPPPGNPVLLSCRAWLGTLLGCLALNAADAPAPAPGTNEIRLTNSPSPLAADSTNADPLPASNKVEAGPTNRPGHPPAADRSEPAPASSAAEQPPDRKAVPETASRPRSAAPELGRPVRPDYASFRIVTERNIFNANRSGGTVRPSRDPRNPAKVEAFRLVGIMDYERGLFAFFDGTSPDYRKALQASGEIAGYTLTNVTVDCVTLAAEGKTYELHVGAQVRREDSGDWQVVSSGEMPAATGGGSTSSGDGGGDDSSGEMSEVLKRLMQQREQE